jgi:hypothetical protein
MTIKPPNPPEYPPEDQESEQVDYPSNEWPFRDLGKNKSRKGGKHGANNKNRHRVFVKWILQTFPQEVQSSTFHPSDPETDAVHSIPPLLTSLQTPTQGLVLDIAGGKGELSIRLSLCHSIQTILIDPRNEDLVQCFDKVIYKSLPKKWQQRITAHRLVHENFIADQLQQRTLQIQESFSIDRVETCPQLGWAVEHAVLLIGLHADGATEDIVDVALKYRKPFVVVPCCVFPNFTAPRWLQTVGPSGIQKVPVRNHAQFCDYLLQKDSHFQKTTLGFEGRNIAVWWDGKCCDPDLQLISQR